MSKTKPTPQEMLIEGVLPQILNSVEACRTILDGMEELLKRIAEYMAEDTKPP